MKPTLTTAHQPLTYLQRWRPTLTSKEIERYDLARALALDTPTTHGREIPDCFERDISDTLRRRWNPPPEALSAGAMLVPFEILRTFGDGAGGISALAHARGVGDGGMIPSDFSRTMQATTPSSGGYAVGMDLLELEEFFRPVSAASRLGAQTVVLQSSTPGEAGQLFQPTTTSDGFTLDWLAENAAAADPAGVNFGARAIPYHRLSGGCEISWQLLRQSRIVSNRVVASMILAAAGVAIDRAILVGAGGSEPTGIINAGDTKSVTFGAAADFTKAVDFEGELADDDIPLDACGWAIGTTALRKWRRKTVDSGGGRFLTERLGDRFETIGYRTEATTLLNTSAKAIFGRFGSATVFQLAGPWLGIQVDRFTAKKRQATQIWLDQQATIDVRGEAFCVSADSAAQ